MRIVSGEPWTTDSRWVVVNGTPGTIVYDPDNGVGCNPDDVLFALMDLQDCRNFIKTREHYGEAT